MPTILLINGWRFVFYADEGKEPPHIHAKKAEKVCKYWLMEDGFEIDEEFTLNMSPVDVSFVRRTIFANFDYILNTWKEFQRKR